MKKNRKILAWLLSFAMLTGCLANGGVVKAEDGETETKYTVTITAGENMKWFFSVGQPTQEVSSQKSIKEIKYEAKDGYYFPADYGEKFKELSEVKDSGISCKVSEDLHTITISGTPTRDVTVILSAATEKRTQSAPDDSVTGGVGKITGTDGLMEYSQDETNWTPCTDNEKNETPVDAGTWYVRYKETNDTKASESKEVTVTANVKVEFGDGADSTMQLADDSGDMTQEKVSGEITPVKYNAKDGYYFPDDYGEKIDEVKGSGLSCEVSEDLKTITISGKPKKSVTVTLPAAKEIEYTITCIYNNGQPDKEITYKINDPDFDLKVPVRTGYTFVGWTETETGKDEELQKDVTIKKGSWGNKKYYAQWEVIRGEIAYSGCDGAENPNTTNKFDVEIGDVELKPATKAHYTFDGWYYNGEKIETLTKEMMKKAIEDGKGIELEAKWLPIKHTVTFKDGTETSLEFNEHEGVSADKFNAPAAREGKIFLGWFEKTDNSVTFYTEIKPGTVDKDITVTAEWADISIPQKELFVAKGSEKNAIRVTTNLMGDYEVSYQWMMNGQNMPNEKKDSISLDAGTLGTNEYSCKITIKRGDFVSSGTTGKQKVTVFNDKISITLKKSVTLKSIFGENRKVTSMTSGSKKYLKVDAKKGTLKSVKYNKKKKQTVNVTITVDGQKINVKVTIKLPKPKIVAKKGKRKKYASGYFRSFVLSYKNIDKGATKVVSKMSKKKKGSFAKGPKILNKLKGTTVSVKKGQIRRIKIVVYYGKGKSPESDYITLKG